MKTRHSQRLTARPKDIAALKHDGFGWDHDVASGRVTLPQQRSPSKIAAFFRKVL